MRLVVLVVLGVLLAPVAALAATSSTQKRLRASKALWATVNICDTPKHPNRIGIRASMPGTSARETMYLRIRVQYLDVDAKKWRFAPKGDSGWEKLGSARYTSRQAGATFRYAPEGFTFRGIVSYHWRRKGKLLWRASELTTAGHKPREADPKGWSRARCRIK